MSFLSDCFFLKQRETCSVSVVFFLQSNAIRHLFISQRIDLKLVHTSFVKTGCSQAVHMQYLAKTILAQRRFPDDGEISSALNPKNKLTTAIKFQTGCQRCHFGSKVPDSLISLTVPTRSTTGRSLFHPSQLTTSKPIVV
ncbi:uncharacterized protein LOC143257685 [Tachypleus tridentatus]|uniref:uncharacterized protein LOC143257685 n=1 Tax=Tachypleus tridentatus TaxID=6853 RepID=UPI003FD41280